MASPYIWGPNSAINLHPNGGDIDQSTGRYRLYDGQKNYVLNGAFETQTTGGWTLGTVAALVNGIPTGTPTFGAGSGPNLSLTTTTASPISGTCSLSAVLSGISTIADCIASPALTIDAEGQAKTLGWKFSYQVASGATNGNFSGTSSNTYGVAFYDVTNSAWLSSTGNFNLVQTNGVGIATGTVTTNVNTASIRYVIYDVTATLGAMTVNFDNFSVGPQVTMQAPAMSDAIPWTPSFTNFGTVTGILCSYYRSGKYLVGNYNFQSGTAVAGVGSFSLPTGLAVDNTVAAGIIEVGGGSTNNTPFAHNIITQTGTSTTLLYFSSAAASYLAPVNGNAWSSLTFFSGTFRIPIVGWSSNSVASADTDTRVIAYKGANTAGTSIANSGFINVPFATTVYDTAGGWNGTQYVVPVSGKYRVSASLSFAASLYAVNNTLQTGIYQNAVGQSYGSAVVFSGAITAQGASSVTATLNCTAGDLIEIRQFNNRTAGATLLDTTAGVNHIEIERISGPAVITATESVNARYHSATATITGAASAVTYTTKDFDSHNAYSGSIYTIPVSGKYQINSSLVIAATFAAGQASFISIYKNGSIYSSAATYAGGVQVDVGTFCADIVQCNAGDTIVIEAASAGGTPTVVASASSNFFSISRVGN